VVEVGLACDLDRREAEDHGPALSGVVLPRHPERVLVLHRLADGVLFLLVLGAAAVRRTGLLDVDRAPNDLGDQIRESKKSVDFLLLRELRDVLIEILEGSIRFLLLAGREDLEKRLQLVARGLLLGGVERRVRALLSRGLSRLVGSG